MRDKQACGCIHNGKEWTTLCVADAAKLAAHKRLAHADYLRTDRRREGASPTELAASPTPEKDWLE